MTKIMEEFGDSKSWNGVFHDVVALKVPEIVDGRGTTIAPHTFAGNFERSSAFPVGEKNETYGKLVGVDMHHRHRQCYRQYSISK